MDRIVISVFGAPVYLTTAFPDGSTPAELFARRLAELSGIDGFEHPPIAIGGELSANERGVVETVPGFSDWEAHFGFGGEAALIYRHLHDVLETGVEQLLVLRLDAPFFDTRQARDLVDLHRRSWCDYTFADGYPVGFTVEVVRRDVLPVLGDLAAAGQLRWKPGVLFETLSRDINAFDIETQAAPDDFAGIRASFTVDTRQNYLLCRRLAEYT
nr:hypothetical protein [Spirochaeta sp.]